VGFKFNHIIFNSLSERMKLEEIPLPEDIKNKDSFDKERSINVKLYKGEKIEKIMLAEMLTSGSVDNHFGLVYPEESYDFPVFEFYFGLVGEGLIAVIELHPLRKEKSYREKYTSPLKKLYQEAQKKIPDPMQSLPEWIEEFLSEYGFFMISTDQHLPKIEETFKSYLELWIA